MYTPTHTKYTANCKPQNAQNGDGSELYYIIVSGGELCRCRGKGSHCREKRKSKFFSFVCLCTRRLMNDSRVAAVLHVMYRYTLYKYMCTQRIPPIYSLYRYNIFAFVDSVLLRGVCLSVV